MSATLENMIDKLDQLSADELVILLEKLSNQLRQKTVSLNPTANQTTIVNPQIQIPSAHQFSSAEIEAELAEIFTSEELAEINRLDSSEIRLWVN